MSTQAQIEERARAIAAKAELMGPKDVPGILAEYERRAAQEARMIADSQAQFEAGEILEEEVYEGDWHFSRGLVRREKGRER